MSVLLAIDPGSSKSAFVAVDTTAKKPISFGKLANEDIMNIVRHEYYDLIAIEGLVSYGTNAQSIIDTAYFIGRLMQIAEDNGFEPDLVLRRQVKKFLLGKSSGKNCNDKAVRQALIDQYGEFTKGMTADVWSAYAVAVTWMNDKEEGEKNDVI